MAARTVRVATWEYLNHEGKRRRAYYGQVIDVPDEETARGEKAGVFGPPADPQAEPSEDEVAEPETQSREDEADSSELDSTGTVPLERPAFTALKSAWVDYAAAVGWDRAQAEDASKAELIKALS